MRRADWEPYYQSIRPFIEDAARSQYRESDFERGFKFWAVSQVLMDLGLSDDEIKEPLALDGRGDLGIDGFYEDAESETLILVQSKFHDSAVAVGNDDINRFYSSLRKVLDPEVVVAARNPLASDAHRATKEAVEKGWTIRFAFITSGYLSPDAETFTRMNQTETEVVDSIEVHKELEVYDVGGLHTLYESHLTPGNARTPTLNSRSLRAISMNPESGIFVFWLALFRPANSSRHSANMGTRCFD